MNQRVMCIEQPLEWQMFSQREGIAIPDVGDPCTVISTVNNSNGKIGYVLQEYNQNVWFAPECFATLPEQSADEMQEENHETIIYAR